MQQNIKMPAMFVLLDHMHDDVPVYRRIGNNQKVKIDKRKSFSIPLRMTFSDESGRFVTIRYKMGASSIYQDKQIKEDNIPANEPFTQLERKMRYFNYGTNIVTDPLFLEYLLATPYNKGFKGFSQTVPKPAFELYDPEREKSEEYDAIEIRLKAANYIWGLDLKSAQDLFILINGSFVELPKDLKACRNALMAVVDDADNDLLNKILSKSATPDEELHILIGKMVGADALSFTAIPNTVAMKKNGKWVELKEMPADYSLEQRERFFVEFLTTPLGDAMLTDLMNSEYMLNKDRAITGRKEEKSEAPKAEWIKNSKQVK